MNLKSKEWTHWIRVNLLIFLSTVGLSHLSSVSAQVVLSEIMYHPVEEPLFNSDGSPVLDLYEDVHEFVELHNPGSAPVNMSGWKLAGGIRYTFQTGAELPAGGYRVVAKNPERLAAVAVYGLVASEVWGPYTNQLSNAKETIRLHDAGNDLVDAVTYSAEFPWAISADGLGANEDFTGLNPLDYQYRGRSLERVSFTHAANDPANWLASPLPGNPSPGRANAVNRPVPLPVIINFSVVQESDEARLVRENQAARVYCTFSSGQALSKVSIEWFVDDINTTAETRTIIPMTAAGSLDTARFTATLPGRANRTIVRFRFLADRGGGAEVISPRRDDPFPWHAYFVTPPRSSTKPIYDCFISTASLNILNANISQSPRRITTPDPPGRPRASWNATQPAVVVWDGVVYDIRMRHHGSRYNRRSSRNSFKWQFPRYQKFNGVTGFFETDKGNDFIVGHNLFIEAGFPVSKVRYVDLYLNNNAVMQRLEQGEFDGDLLDSFHEAQQKLNPGKPLEPSGEIYKSVGTIETNGEGPYGRGDGRKLVKPNYWTDLQMYDWTYSLQNNGWRGSFQFKQMVDAMWAARGDTPNAPNPNVPALRSFFLKYFDIEEMLNYIAVENWVCPWDDTTQNYFLWQKRDGKWGLLPWDCDAWFGRGDNTPASASIYIGEVGDRSNNFRGPNFFKDGFIKAFRNEYKARLYLLNNTLLHPENITAMGFGSIRSFADARFAAVNSQCALGPFQRPTKPANISPANNSSALPSSALQGSAYTHSAPGTAHQKTIWEIRSVGGSYREPVWKTTSTNSLVSIPIPFEQLEFGQSYFWRCTYVDANDHPSIVSDETSFKFGSAPSQVTLVALDAASRWRYQQTADLSGVNWTARDYDDSSWSVGAPLLGVESAALPEPLRTLLVLGRATYYFRTRFSFAGDPAAAQLALRHVLDDGAVIYLNGTEILRTGMPAGVVTGTTLANRTTADAVYEGPFTISNANLQRGENVFAVEVHQVALNSSDIVFGLTLEATVAAVSGELVLNEIAARNQGSVVHAGATPDWIELFNNSARAIDLAGMSLSDDVLIPGKYIFPPGTVIPAQGYLTLWCDNATNSPGLHTGFALNDKGQTIALFAQSPNGIALRDHVTYGPQMADLTIARTSDGTGDWVLSHPTLSQKNRAASTSLPVNLRINEWMAAPVAGDDWFEIYNPGVLPVSLAGLYLTDSLNNPTNTRIPALSFIAPGGFVEFAADEKPANGPDHTNFKLSSSGDAIYLVAANGATLIDSISFGPQSSGTSQGRLPDGSQSFQLFPATSSPGASNHLPINSVVINEVLSHSDPPLEDAIELHNLSAATVDLSGWFLSDQLDQLKKFRIPAGTQLAPGGFKVFYEIQFNGDVNSGFSLSSALGDDVYLSAADSNGTLTGYRTHVDFGPAANGVSFGRIVTSAGVDFTTLSRRTFGLDSPGSVSEFRSGAGAANATPLIGPIVISEIMYHPPDNGTNDNQLHEFIELQNITSSAVPLFDPIHSESRWRLRDAVDFDFPPNVTMAPFSFLVIVSFDPARDAAAREAFQARYGPQSQWLGPFLGKLDNSSESVRLFRPDPPQTAPSPNSGLVPYILIDRVKYSDIAPWPAEADGTGPSLQRLNPNAYGNEPANWFASGFTPGRSHLPVNNSDSDGDGMPDAWESANGLDPAMNDAGLDSDGDGLINVHEFMAGTSPKNAASSLALVIYQNQANLVLRFTAQSQKAYRIESSSNLGANSWQTFRDIPSDSIARDLEVPLPLAAAAGANQFYRIRVVP